MQLHKHYKHDLMTREADCTYALNFDGTELSVFAQTYYHPYVQYKSKELDRAKAYKAFSEKVLGPRPNWATDYFKAWSKRKSEQTKEKSLDCSML